MLNNNTTPADFKKIYYYKQDLVQFCQVNKIPYSGLMKHDLEQNILAFLKGEKPAVKPKKKKSTWVQDKLGLDCEITENFKCNPETRRFFQSIIGPKFHFFLGLIHYKEEHPNQRVTYQDLVNCWYTEQENRKKGIYSTEKYAVSNRYNKFMRMFYADPNNKGKTHKHMIAAWEELKKSGRVNEL
jgi:hypothetical protein